MFELRRVMSAMLVSLLIFGQIFAQTVAPAKAALSTEEQELAAKIDLQTIKDGTATLSSDEMEGRGTMQPGEGPDGEQQHHGDDERCEARHDRQQLDPILQRCGIADLEAPLSGDDGAAAGNHRDGQQPADNQPKDGFVRKTTRQRR